MERPSALAADTLSLSYTAIRRDRRETPKPYSHNLGGMAIGKAERDWAEKLVTLNKNLPPRLTPSQIENCCFLCRELSYTAEGVDG